MLFLLQTDQTALSTGVSEAQSKAAFPAQVLEDKEDLKKDRVPVKIFSAANCLMESTAQHPAHCLGWGR